MRKAISNHGAGGRGKFLAVIILAGCILRLLCCFLGYPQHLHPDEHTVVDAAVGMLRNATYFAESYNRPDQFEIKCDALLFAVFSVTHYHASAADAFASHATAFYLVARFFTVLLGTLMIPLGYFLGRKVQENAGLLSAFFIAMFPLFVRHSAYATPDIPLTFFVMLTLLTSFRYLEGGSRKMLLLLCLEVAVSITIKYPGAVSGLYAAVVVLLRAKREHAVKGGILKVLLCIPVTVAFVFAIMPNLFFNYRETISVFLTETRPYQLGVASLGFFGKIVFYCRTFLEAGGAGFIFPILLGVVFCFRKMKSAGLLMMLQTALYLVCISAVKLHWARWGMPMYFAPLVLAAAGIMEAAAWLKEKKESRRGIKVAGTGALAALTAILAANVALGSAAYTAECLAPQTQVVSLAFTKANGITKENAATDGYSPLNLSNPGTLTDELDVKDGKFVSRSGKDIRYAVLSSNMTDRFFREEKKYPQITAVYRKIMQEGKLLAQYEKTDFATSPSAVINIADSIRRIAGFAGGAMNGPTISIYRIK